MMAVNAACASAGAVVNTQPWDVAAHGWNQHAALIHRWLHSVTQTMLDDAHIGPGARVLDVAAGAGDQTVDIAHRIGPTGWVLATDVSPSILALGQKNFDASGLLQVTTRLADAQTLGLAGSNFDAAVCRLGLMFCCTPLAALRQIRAALKPHGRLTALVFGRPENNPCLAMTLGAAREHAGQAEALNMNASRSDSPGSLMSLGKPGLLDELMQSAGFEGVTTRYVSVPFHAASAEQYVEFLRTSASPVIEILAPLPIAAKQAAWRDITEKLEVFSTPQGWIGPNELLQCVAVAPG